MQFKVRKRLESYQLGPSDPRNELGIILNPFFQLFLTLSKMAKFQKIRYFQSLIASQKSLRYGSDGYRAGPGVWTDGSDPIWTHLTHNLGVWRLQNLTQEMAQNWTAISALMGSDSPFEVRYGSDGYGVGPGVWTNGSDPIWPHLTHILGVWRLQKNQQKGLTSAEISAILGSVNGASRPKNMGQMG